MEKIKPVYAPKDFFEVGIASLKTETLCQMTLDVQVIIVNKFLKSYNI